MLGDNTVLEGDVKLYNVTVNGVLKQTSVTKLVVESYIRSLSLNEQSQTAVIPVTAEGKEILFG